MYLLQLPDDIIIKIVDEMNDNILSVSIVNKELLKLSETRIRKAKEKYNRKIMFYKKCSILFKHGEVYKIETGFQSLPIITSNSVKNISFIQNGFQRVTSIEECYFIYDYFVKKFGKETFISRVHYTIKNTHQIQAETWTLWLSIYNTKTIRNNLIQ
jgi:hypothetical protein